MKKSFVLATVFFFISLLLFSCNDFESLNSDSEESSSRALCVAEINSENSTFSGTIENITQIDELIKNHLSNWEFDRVNRVSVAILRMSVYSLLFMKDIEPSIVIDEAIDIAKNFGPDDSYKFVNAILDNIKKSI